MRSTLDAFLVDISELKAFVESIELVYKILAQHRDSTLRACLNIRRRLDYTAFTIALYAALEKFVEDIAWMYTDLESSRNEYPGLSDKLRSKHMRQSADLLFRGRLGEGRYSGITELDVVENLHACLSGKNPYKLNRHAIVHHDQNLRSNEVQTVFAALGIDNMNDQACCTEPMIAWYCKENDTDINSIHKVQPAIVDLRLKDLVERRNQVAHAGSDMNESIDSDEMRSKLDFLRAYSSSLFSVIAATYLDRYYIKSGRATSLGYPVEGPFKKGAVVVVRKPACTLYRGQPIVGVHEKRVDRWGEILELEVDDVAVQSIEPDSVSADVGLCADFKFTKGIELYALAEKDEIIWG